MLRSPETANSRPMIRIAIQPGSTRTCTREISAAEISSLSAIGSSSVPMVVTCFQRRARYPSSRSVPGGDQENRQRQPLVGDERAEPDVDVFLHQRRHQQRHEEDAQDRQ